MGCKPVGVGSRIQEGQAVSTNKTFTGTPQDIGADFFCDICMPVIRQASQHMEPNQLAQLYAGLIGAAFGSMSADFGQQNALQLFQVMADGFAKFQPFEETH